MSQTLFKMLFSHIGLRPAKSHSLRVRLTQFRLFSRHTPHLQFHTLIYQSCQNFFTNDFLFVAVLFFLCVRYAMHPGRYLTLIRVRVAERQTRTHTHCHTAAVEALPLSLTTLAAART